jgi:hypothetical protein
MSEAPHHVQGNPEPQQSRQNQHTTHYPNNLFYAGAVFFWPCQSCGGGLGLYRFYGNVPAYGNQ